MTFSKEQLSQAFIQVLNERTPDLSGIPDHVFSERFEKKMQKLIDREAAHPWAVSHTAARNLLIAAIVLILMLVLCMSVSGIRNAIFNFFLNHFETYDEVVFDETDGTKIEHVYEITQLPEGFTLNQKQQTDFHVIRKYENSEHEWISFRQKVVAEGTETKTDNERSEMQVIDLDGQILFNFAIANVNNLAWEKDGYEFWIETNCGAIQLKDLLEIYKSIQ